MQKSLAWRLALWEMHQQDWNDIGRNSVAESASLMTELLCQSRTLGLLAERWVSALFVRSGCLEV